MPKKKSETWETNLLWYENKRVFSAKLVRFQFHTIHSNHQAKLRTLIANVERFQTHSSPFQSFVLRFLSFARFSLYPFFSILAAVTPFQYSFSRSLSLHHLALRPQRISCATIVAANVLQRLIKNQYQSNQFDVHGFFFHFFFHRAAIATRIQQSVTMKNKSNGWNYIFLPFKLFI